MQVEVAIQRELAYRTKVGMMQLQPLESAKLQTGSEVSIHVFFFFLPVTFWLILYCLLLILLLFFGQKIVPFLYLFSVWKHLVKGNKG